MSKKFRGKLCVYCAARVSGTRDHVVAREFFLESRRSNLPQVPACLICNGAKSKLEHYLMSVLPFGGVHADAAENLQTQVPRRLERNQRLLRELSAGRKQVWARAGEGILLPTISLPLNFTAVDDLFRYIVKGLMWHHWSVYLTNEHFVTVIALTAEGDRFFRDRFFGASVTDSIANDLGSGTFNYSAVQSTSYPELSVWRITMYGGISLGGDPNAPNENTTSIGAFTGHIRIRENARDWTLIAPND